MWLIDKLFNRKIEGKSSLDYLAELSGEDISYLKSIEESLGEEELAWVSQMKDLVSVDEDDVVNIEDLKTISDLIVGQFLYISSIVDIKDNDDNSFFPELTDQAGKVVKVNDDETGFEYGEVSGGTKLYLHHITSGNDDLLIISTRSEPYDTTSTIDLVIGNDGIIQLIYSDDVAGTTYICNTIYSNFDQDDHLYIDYIYNGNSGTGTYDFNGATDTVTPL